MQNPDMDASVRLDQPLLDARSTSKGPSQRKAALSVGADLLCSSMHVMNNYLRLRGPAWSASDELLLSILVAMGSDEPPLRGVAMLIGAS